MIYSVITIKYGRVDDIKTFKNSDNAVIYFREQGEWADDRYGEPNIENDDQVDDFDCYGEAEMVFRNGDCRVYITTHSLY